MPVCKEFALQIGNLKFFKTQCSLDGKWTNANDGKTIEVNNPASGAIISTAPKAGRTETATAVETASHAFGPWKRLTALQRAARLHERMAKARGLRISWRPNTSLWEA
ncbi:MAG: aldehyde dehydrogenase family protein [Desulfovibrio sp.]|nr:aldehyde dehydrogenase family protein [Desulfovibrio sp.]MBI4957860.1 aldehyde dehydrogenase family protein [Desulfovibrio sp.]